MKLLALAGVAAFCAETASAAVIHITDGDSRAIMGINLSTGAVTYSTTHTAGDRLYAIAVVGSEVSLASYASNAAATLDISGQYVAGSTYPGAPIPSLDATSDGNKIYAASFDSDPTITQYDLDWSNPVPLFSITAETSFNFGTAFDTTANTLWISSPTTIYQYSLEGDLISSFSHGGGRGALAIDNESGSLWYVPNDSEAALLQYGKDGNLMLTLFTEQRLGNVWGAEISVNPVPEPSVALLSVGALGLCLTRRRRA
jgi:hypothetical protein